MAFEILIIEDMLDNAEEIEQLFKALLPGASISKITTRPQIDDSIAEWTHGGEASSYDIIVIDLNLPDFEGVNKTFSDLPSQLRTVFPKSSITVFSAYLDDSDLQELTAMENIHIVTKPIAKNIIDPIMRDLGNKLLSSLRTSVGSRAKARGAHSYRRPHFPGGCSTIQINRVLDDILSIYKRLPIEVKENIQNYVSIREDNGKLWVDVQ